MAVVRLIRELPEDERPRERMLAHGPATLGDAELVAVLLRTGRAGASALTIARELLSRHGGLEGLASCRRAPELAGRGLGEAKAATLLAAAELGRRLVRARIPEREPLSRPAAAASYLALRYAGRDQEVLGALYLDTRNRLLAERELYRGTLNRAAVEPRLILKEGLLRGAAAMIVFHTHPSGDPTPSAEDLAFTRRLAEAGEIVGIRLVDHLILGSGASWLSLAERGGW
jgi:DNA repair protein RadC